MECPSCGKDVNRRQNGQCPFCHAAIRKWRGIWIMADEKAPNAQIVELFENLLSRRLSEHFRWKRGSTQHTRELALASRYLDRCGTLSVALRALQIQFEDRRFSWKERTSIAHCFHDLDVAVTIAKRLLREERERDQRNQEALSRIMSMEDVFA